MAKEQNIILPVIGLGALLLIFSGGDNKGTQTVLPPGTKLTPTDFLKRYWHEAVLSQNATTIPALATITQGGIESNWGNSAPGYNFFGIHADKSWKGPVILRGDKDAYGHPYTVAFRAYPNAHEGFIDHGRFFIDNARYRPALKYVSDPMRFAQMIAAEGYAEDPKYSEKLTTAMRLVMKLLQSNKLV